MGGILIRWAVTIVAVFIAARLVPPPEGDTS